MQFASANYLAIVVAAVAAWITGAIWYNVLAKAWVTAQGKTLETFKQEQAAKAGQPGAFVPYMLAFLANLIMAFVLYGLMRHIGPFSVRAGLISGAFCWFGFVVTTMAVNNAFGDRKPMLTAIDAGHWLVALLVIGAILGAFGG